MKKVLLFSTLIALLLIVTGCSNSKRVICNQKVSVVDVDMLLDFDNDVLSGMGLKYTMDLSSGTDEQIKEFESQNLCSTVQESMGTYKDAFTNCKQSLNGKKLEITADFILEKLPGYSKDKKETMEESIKQLEDQGYKCEK